MADPAMHSARAEAERLGVLVGTDVDRIEDALLAEPVEEAELFGAWVRGEGRPA